MPSQRQQTAKKAYSTPTLADLGAVKQLSLSGTGTLQEGANASKKRHPKP
jgi:hypothetical protein